MCCRSQNVMLMEPIELSVTEVLTSASTSETGAKNKKYVGN